MDLNIVAVPASSVGASGAGAVSGTNPGNHNHRKKKKKNSKYERRRRKAVDAKEAVARQKRQEETKRAQQHDLLLQRYSGHSGGGGAATTVSEPEQQERPPAGGEQERRPHSEDDEGGENSSNNNSNAEESTAAADEVSGTGSSDNDSDGESSDDQEDEEEPRPPPVEKKSSGLPDDDEERAKYLSEFHARPLELDRRAGVVFSRSAAGGQSKDSSHLFSHEASGWDAFGLHDRLVAVVTNTLHLERPTTVQARALPAILSSSGPRDDDEEGKPQDNNNNSDNNNVLVHSETGSGKTLAYLLPILQSLATADRGEGNGKTANNNDDDGLRIVDRAKGGTRCVILCPTRELALQTLAAAETLCSGAFNWLVPGCLFGEERRKSEKARIRKGISVLVATPGRLLDHLTRTESLLMALKGKLEWLVLDEADRLLDMGLGDQVRQIVQRIRANQPGSGPARNGITWRCVLLSATVTPQVETLAKETLVGGSDNSWTWIKGGNGGSSSTGGGANDNNGDDGPGGATDGKRNNPEAEGYADSTPRQLSQLHMTVSAKLRLAALVAFLVQRVQKRDRVVVFLSTCASVDYYHALFQAADSILADDDKDANDSEGKGIFGEKCSVYKLHGSIPHGERQLTLKRFVKHGSNNNVKGGGGTRTAASKAVQQQAAAILFATDVAARGLNLPDVDWTVQYDPPSEVSDYVHRIGRVCRAGRAGHSLVFLLPSERPFLDVLKKRGVKNVSALSLASTLNAAAGICRALTAEGVRRSGGGLSSSSSGHHARVGSAITASRSGEAFSCELQRLLEECVTDDDAEARATAKANRKHSQRRQTQAPERVSGALLEMARLAFVSHIRAYPTKEKLLRPIFASRSLHLGHVARSFALKEPPKKLAKNTSGRASAIAETANSRKRNSAMSFKPLPGEEEGEDGGSKKKQRKGDGRLPNDSNNNPTKNARALLMANAAKLEMNGFG